jgi:hypothetical protein
MFTSRSACAPVPARAGMRRASDTARSAAMRAGADIGDATFAFRVSLFNAHLHTLPRPMITRLDRTVPFAAGLVAVARGVPSARVRGKTHSPIAGAWCSGRMQGMVTKNPRDVQSRHNRGAGPAAGAHAR